MKVTKLHPDARIPTRGTSGSAGLDLYACDGGTVRAGTHHMHNVRIAVEIPMGYYGQIASRSSLAAKHNIVVTAGVIDSDYRGPLIVGLHNFGTDDYSYLAGERIAQLLLLPCWMGDVEEVSGLEDTMRGDGRMGSTGR